MSEKLLRIFSDCLVTTPLRRKSLQARFFIYWLNSSSATYWQRESIKLFVRLLFRVPAPLGNVKELEDKVDGFFNV